MQDSAKLGLREAIKAYWFHILPFWLFAPFVFYTLRSVSDESAAWPWILLMFFLTSFFWSVPIMRGRVGWSYQILGGLLYVFGGFAVIVLIELVRGRLE